MQAPRTTQFVTDARVRAMGRRGHPEAVGPHADRGSPYTSAPFPRFLADHGVTCRMSRSGNCGDTATRENVCASLKTERTAAKTYRTRDQANADGLDSIERFSNLRRRHSTLGALSPMELERQAEFA